MNEKPNDADFRKKVEEILRENGTPEKDIERIATHVIEALRNFNAKPKDYQH